MKLLSRFAIAAIVGFSVSSLIASASYSLGLWRGGGIFLLTVVRYSCIFAVLLGVAAATQPRRTKVQKGSLLVAVFSGTILAVAGCYYVWRFSLPIHRQAFLMLSCWVPAGISAMLAAAFGKRTSIAAGIVILGLCAIFLHEPIFNASVHYQQLTVAFVTPVDASTSQLEANPDKLGFMTDQEIETATNDVMQRLRTLGYSEKFRVLSLTKQGKGKNALAIVVIRTRVSENVVLPEPKASTVVYVQESDRWEKKPPEAPTLLRGIELEAARPPDETLAYFTIRWEPVFGVAGRIKGKTSDLPMP
jgi:hypothetical protein